MKNPDSMPRDEEDLTISMFDRTSTLSSSGDLSSANKRMLSVQNFFPRFVATPPPTNLDNEFQEMSLSKQPTRIIDGSQSFNLQSKSEDTVVVGSSEKKRKSPDELKKEKLQTLDEIFMELDEQKLQKQKQQQQQQQQPAGVLKKKDSFREKEKLYLDSDDSSDDGLRTRISRPRKQISWRYSRTPSPMPAQKSRDASPVPAASRKSRTPSPATPALQKVPSQSRIIAQNLLLQATNAAADAPPPLPYNIKSKKRNARRIQSIHHMVEPPSSLQSSSDQERSDRSEPEQASEKSVSVEAGNTTEDSGSWERPPVVEPSVQPEAAHAPLNLTSPSKKTLLVPCRLTDSSMVDLTMLPKPFTAKDQIRLAMLLSTQESKYGFNMFDSLVPGDNEEIARLMSMGIRYEDAVLIVFEKRYVTKPHEQLRSSPIPLNEYKPHVLASIPSTAAQTLGAELGRSMSPKPRPQSLPVTLARHENPDLESYSGDYGLNQHEYPGYTTVHHSNSAGPASANVSRTHSPFPYMQPSSAGASRTHSPHPADLYVNRQVPSVGASRTQSPMPTTGSFMANSPMPGAMNSRTHSPHPQNNNNYARPMPIPPPIVIPHSPQAQPAVAYYQQPVQAQAQFLDPMPPRSHGGSAVSSRNASRAHTPMNSPGTNLNNNHNNNTPTNQNTVYYDNPLKGTPPSPHHHHHPVVAPVPHNPGRGAPYSAPLPAGSIEPSSPGGNNNNNNNNTKSSGGTLSSILGRLTPKNRDVLL